jgi:hypothetical protein
MQPRDCLIDARRLPSPLNGEQANQQNSAFLPHVGILSYSLRNASILHLPGQSG